MEYEIIAGLVNRTVLVVRGELESDSIELLLDNGQTFRMFHVAD